MEENYNRVSILFKFLNNFHDRNKYTYVDSCKSYPKKYVDFPSDTLVLVERLKHYRLSDFYTSEGLKANSFSEDFYNSELVRETDTHLEFHLELPNILFFCLLNDIEIPINQFLEIINSQDFKDRFMHQFEMTEDFFKYSIQDHKEIYDYLNSRIDKFELMNRYLNMSGGIYYTIRSVAHYDIKTIKRCLEELNNYNLDSGGAIEL